MAQAMMRGHARRSGLYRFSDSSFAIRLLHDRRPRSWLHGRSHRRMTGTVRSTTYTPGFWTGGPYRHLWGAGLEIGLGERVEPGYLTTDKIVRADTLVYSLERDELVWRHKPHVRSRRSTAS